MGHAFNFLKSQLAAVAVCLALGGLSPAAAEEVRAEVTFARTSKDVWNVTYKFSQPVTAVHLGPEVEGYRENYWRIITPGVRFVSGDDGESLVADGGVSEIILEARRYTVMPEANYMPFAWFSDNGASMYLGHFMGEVEIADEATYPQYYFILKGRPGENTLMPLRTGNEPVFAYFGPQDPVETDSIILIADPGLPSWLKETVEESVPALAGVYQGALQITLPAKPVVMIPAGGLDIFSNERHLKGGALKHQFNLTFAGALPGREQEGELQKLIAHEMGHLWQRPEGIDDFGVPWVYEGGADAMAVAALLRAEIWEGAQVQAFSEDAARRCEEDLGDMTLDQAEANNNWAAAYSCGYVMYAQTGVDVLALWALMVRHPDAGETGYTPEILNASLPVN